MNTIKKELAAEDIELQDEMIRTPEAAALADRSKPTLYSWVNQGKLKDYRKPGESDILLLKSEVIEVSNNAPRRNMKKKEEGTTIKAPLKKVARSNGALSKKKAVKKTMTKEVASIEMAQPDQVSIGAIKFDPETQIREKVDQDIVKKYAAAMHEGDRFSPVTLFKDEKGRHYIGDGWHRLKAALKNGYQNFPAIVSKGGKAAAIRFGLSANATHGVRRTHRDIKKAVTIAWREFPKFSNREIAKLCAVDDKTAATHAPSCGISATERSVGADGKSYARHKPNSIPPDKQLNAVYKRVKKNVRKFPEKHLRQLALIIEELLAGLKASEAEESSEEEADSETAEASSESQDEEVKP